MQYSQDFQNLVKKFGERELIEGSFVKGANLKRWEEMRRFVAPLVNQDGSVLDIGCANGFLLRCLQEWSAHKLIPYGIDVSAPHIRRAKEIFPEEKNSFATLGVEELPKIIEFGLPVSYQMVYWGVWDNYFFDNQGNLDILRQVFNLVNSGGRLILTFYNRPEEGVQAEKKISQIQDAGYQLSGRVNNPDRSEIAIWLDK